MQEIKERVCVTPKEVEEEEEMILLLLSPKGDFSFSTKFRESSSLEWSKNGSNVTGADPATNFYNGPRRRTGNERRHFDAREKLGPLTPSYVGNR